MRRNFEASSCEELEGSATVGSHAFYRPTWQSV